MEPASRSSASLAKDLHAHIGVRYGAFFGLGDDRAAIADTRA